MTGASHVAHLKVCATARRQVPNGFRALCDNCDGESRKECLRKMGSLESPISKFVENQPAPAAKDSARPDLRYGRLKNCQLIFQRFWARVNHLC